MLKKLILATTTLLALSASSSAVFLGGYFGMTLNGLHGPKDATAEVHTHSEDFIAALSLGHDFMTNKHYGVGVEGYLAHDLGGKKPYHIDSSVYESAKVSRTLLLDIKPIWQPYHGLQVFGILGYSLKTIAFDHTASSSTTEYKKALHGIRFGGGTEFFFNNSLSTLAQASITKLTSDKLVASSVNNYNLGGKTISVVLGAHYHF